MPEKRHWYEKLSNDIHGSFWEGAERLHEYISLQEENDRLSRENSNLVGDILFRSSHPEDTLRWDIGRIHFKTTPARVVSMSRGSQHNYLILDRGLRDGVSRDDGVITGSGVIGIVHSVGDRFCYVLSFMNQDMAISAKLGREGYVGIMQWKGMRTGESVLGNIPIHIDSNPGDTVFTSGFSSIFPPDIPLGVVSGSRSDDGSSADITVKLFDDYAKVYHVMIVKNLDKEQIQSLEE